VCVSVASRSWLSEHVFLLVLSDISRKCSTYIKRGISVVFTVHSSTDEIVENLDLTNVTAIITGSSGGLGAETARAIASKGATVILVARDEDKLKKKAEELKLTTNNSSIFTQAMDLSDLNSVRAAAAEIIGRFPKINVLINNAGIMACPLSRTAQDFESQIGVNHIGHFVFTQELLPALEAAAPSRIVILTSGAHKLSNVNLDDLNWKRREYDKWVAYGQSKTANALFATALQNRLSGLSITANCVHPGVIMTELGRSMTDEDLSTMAAPGMKVKPIEVGAATTVWAAVSPQLEGQGGLYLEDCHVGVELDESHTLAGYCAYALDPIMAELLWEKTEEMINGL
jgi:NAD(P)-dependent dehydrogenase (short-subunit alcohol dehydrogenase family)